MTDIAMAATHDPQSSGSELRVVAKEYRFSVVMYGGVSLAIYMNGIAQELLRMVRSTARTSWDNEAGTDFRYSVDQLSSTEKIYRAVARALNDSDVDDVRFVIDTIAGTSAGGINGIFLAKALTDDSLDFGALQNLWVTEGALERLLNDHETTRINNLPTPDPPKSLLCSDRMYIELLKAFQGMGETRDDGGGQPLCQEIDLFVTTTDITGRVIPLRLSDRLVYERKYKTDFHFRYKMPRKDGSHSHGNDLESSNNPFIAFVARCTSSFPFAFEPMQLKKLLDLQETKAWPDNVNDVSDEQLKAWEYKFFDNSAQVLTGSNRTRAFGDGGYLNNKPFSYVVEMLGRHSSTFPTERNLIYVEPTPDHPETDARVDLARAEQGTNAPNALQNSFDALMKLPDYQAIHDDLQRVIERNRLVRKVAELSAAVTAKIDGAGKLKEAGAAAGRAVPQLEFKPRFALLHPEYSGDFGYLNLCVYSTTDQLSKVLSEWDKYPTESSYYYAIRCLVRVWREQSYRKDEVNAVGKAKSFLNDFDLDYEKRRYRFVRQQINVFYTLDQTACNRLRTGFGIEFSDSDKGFRDDFRKALIALKKPFDEASGIISDTLREIRPGLKPAAGDATAQELEDAFENLKKIDIAFAIRKIAATIDDKRAHKEPAPAGALNDERVTTRGLSVIDYVLGVEARSKRYRFAPSRADVAEDYLGRAAKVIQSDASGLNAAGGRVAKALSAVMKRGIERSQVRLRQQWAALEGGLPRTRGGEVALHIVNFFYANFESFDIAIFPLTYDTDVGVPELIKVLRVSPDDANSIYKQTEHPNDPKLAGTSLAHFGAFLDRSFRTNDILWGRLDGAERIIRALLGNRTLIYEDELITVDDLIQKANEIIVAEFLSQRQNALRGVIFEVAKSLNLDAKQAAELDKSQIDAIKVRVKQAASPLSLDKLDLSAGKIIEYLKQPPQPRQPDRQSTLQSSTRAIRIVGGILEGMGKETKAAGGFLIRCATALWWLVEAAIPNGLAGHFARKFFALLFLFEFVLFVGGTLLSHPMQTLGLELLIITSLLWLIKDAFQNYLLSGKKGLRKTMVYVVLAIFLGLSTWLALWIWGDKLPLIEHRHKATPTAVPEKK